MHNFQVGTQHFEVLVAEGPDTVRFLEGQLTCDVANLPTGHVQFGAACNNKGRVIAGFCMVRADNKYFLCCSKGVGSQLLEVLKKFLPFYKGCSLCLAPSSVSLTGLAGEELLAMQRSLGLASQQPGTCASIETGGWLALIPGSYPRGLRYATNNVNTHEQAMDNLSAWEALALLDGHFPFRREDSEAFTPQEIHYDRNGYVSFTKGCYTGQEIVARMHYRGKLKKELVIVSGSLDIKDPQTTTYELFGADGKLVGSLMRWCRLGVGSHGLGLAQVSTEVSQTITTLCDSKRLVLKVLPFSSTSGSDKLSALML